MTAQRAQRTQQVQSPTRLTSEQSSNPASIDRASRGFSSKASCAHPGAAFGNGRSSCVATCWMRAPLSDGLGVGAGDVAGVASSGGGGKDDDSGSVDGGEKECERKCGGDVGGGG